MTRIVITGDGDELAVSADAGANTRIDGSTDTAARDLPLPWHVAADSVGYAFESAGAAYVTVEEYRDWSLGIASGPAPTDDTLLTRLLSAARTVVDEHCKRRWADATEQRAFWPSSATASRLVVGIASAATAVHVDGDELAVAEWALRPSGTDGAILVRKRGRWEPPSCVELSATFDAGAVPDAVVEAVCRIVSRWLTSALAAGLDSINVLDTGVTITRSWRDPDVVQLLERHVVDFGR